MHWKSVLSFFSVFKKRLVVSPEHVFSYVKHSDINIYLKNEMDENLSNFIQAQYTNLG